MKVKNSKMSESLKGNTNGTKLKEAAVRQEAFRQYCEHLAEGYPKEAFFFDHEEHSVCWKTMDRYIEENPSEFPAIKIQRAKAKRYKHWLGEGKKMMTGGYERCSPTIWTVMMRNIFKENRWDQDINVEVAPKSESATFQLAQAKSISLEGDKDAPTK